MIWMTVRLFNKEKIYSFQTQGQTCFRFVLFLSTSPTSMQSSFFLLQNGKGGCPLTIHDISLFPVFTKQAQIFVHGKPFLGKLMI